MKSIQDVEQLFRDQILIPENRPAKQVFFCPVGLVGAGKTTVTKPIAEALGLVRLSSDELRKLLKESGHGYEQVKEIALRIADDFIEQGDSIAFDMDCGNVDLIAFVRKMEAERGIKTFWVHMNTPEAFIFEKFRRHPPSWLADNPQTMIDNYHTQKEKRLKENSQFNFDYTFDTSRPDVQKQIEECAVLIRKKIGE